MVFQLPPLSLYVHIPWCLRKCPYCDFNSHEVRSPLNEQAYVSALLADLQQDLPSTLGRPLGSIFIGGGTPSLFSADAIQTLLSGIGAMCELSPEIEITLEANPGTAEAKKFIGFREAGVNRLSIGVQSFNNQHLQALGRVHDSNQAINAVQLAKQAGFDRVNIDLMFGLPGQSGPQALEDIETAVALEPGHISYYQLTLEPNTAFYANPPVVPSDEKIWEIHQQGLELLQTAGYSRYEISAFSKQNQRSGHNFNYWTFGDYLGIGAGAHAKLSDKQGHIKRLWKWRNPEDYLKQTLADNPIQGVRELTETDVILEFMMNILRLPDGFSNNFFTMRTGVSFNAIEAKINQGVADGLLLKTGGQVKQTNRGLLFLNDLLELFVPEGA